MSSIGAIGEFPVMSYQMSSRAMLDAASADEGDEDGELMVESENDVDIEVHPGDDAGADDSEPGSSLGGQIDAWG